MEMKVYKCEVCIGNDCDTSCLLVIEENTMLPDTCPYLKINKKEGHPFESEWIEW